MYIWLLCLIPIYMAITSRMAGGGLGAHHLDKYNITWLPEVFFAIPFGVVCGYLISTIVDNIYIISSFGVIGFIWSYIWMQTGHAAVLPWNDINKQIKKGRDNTLTPYVIKICKLFGIEYEKDNLYTEAYAWTFMGVKGFLIGLPALAFPLILFWPLGYEIGSHMKGRVNKYGIDPHSFAELSAGFGAGISLVITLLLIGV